MNLAVYLAGNRVIPILVPDIDEVIVIGLFFHLTHGFVSTIKVEE